MKIYADTSFLISLYVDTDVMYEQACAEKETWTQDPELPLTPFGWVEIENTLARLEHKKILTMKAADAIAATIKADIDTGFLRSAPLHAYEWLSAAHNLSRKITSVTGTRTLDILHLALAKSERCTHMATFDANQRRAALAAGLRVLPAAAP